MDRTRQLRGCAPGRSRGGAAGKSRLARLALGLLLLPLCSLAAFGQTLNVGVYQNPPKLMLNEDGQMTGIFGDLLNEIAAREEWAIVPVPCEWELCMDLLGSGQIDLLPDVAYSESRAESLDFHQVPALHGWSQIYQRDGADIQSIPDLAGKRVAVLTGSIQEGYLHHLTDNFGLAVIWLPVSSYADGFALLASGEADAVSTNHHYGDLQTAQMKVEPTPIAFQPAKLYFASPRGSHPEALATIDSYLSQWQTAPGSPYQKIIKRWNPGQLTLMSIPTYIFGVGALLATLLILALIFNLLLRNRVNRRTRELRDSERRLNTILNSVQAHIYIKDNDLCYQYANQKLCDLLGKSEAEVVGKRDDALFDASAAQRRQRSDRDVLDLGARTPSEEVCELCENGVRRTFVSVKIPLRDAKDNIYALCGIDTDITEYRNIQKAIHQLAFYDPLTELPNRSLLLDRVRHALANQQQTGFEGALLFIDLDNFKNINDTLGHDQGDELLRQVSVRLNAQLRPTDTLARPGGDEFVLLLEGLHQNLDQAADKAKIVAQQTIEQISLPLSLDGVQHVTTASIGIVMFCDGQNNPEELLKRSELAMYEAKQGGRNNLQFFNPIMQAQANRRASVEADLRKAVERNQMALHVQPQVDQTGRIQGMEALLRWTHPTEGPISPASFIPIAESSGLIVSLGEWVLREACALLDEWSQQPEMAHLTLAVNISPRQFRHAGFVDLVLGLLEQARFSPHRLELELTESLLVEDIDVTGERMRVLGTHGVRFSLDDFGTGYASLGYLKRLPLYQLKIDQSFVREVLTDPNDVAIISTIVALGNSLDLRVIAEGVETEAQRDRLLELGCMYYQGYYFGRPAPAARMLSDG